MTSLFEIEFTSILTQAEAMAAYEQRCQRRLRNKRPVHIPAGEADGIHFDSSVSMACATASVLMKSTAAEDLHEVFISVPPSSDAAQGLHGDIISTATSQPVSSSYTGNPLASGRHLNLPAVQKQSSK